MRPLRFLRVWLNLGRLLVGLVIFFSLIPSPPSIPGLPGWDKLSHLAAYALMMTWFGFIYMPGRRYLTLGAGFIIMGILLELIQGLTGYRDLEVNDMTANALGVSLGWFLVRGSISSTLVRFERLLVREY